MINRREFVSALAAAATVSTLKAQAPNWGGPVIDMHFHMRGTPEANLAHLDGCGVSNANLLTQSTAAERVHTLQTQYPKRFSWYASSDITKPTAEALLTQAVKDGAGGLGELKFRAEADGPEF